MSRIRRMMYAVTDVQFPHAVVVSTLIRGGGRRPASPDRARDRYD
jgi:hypothetical protein